MSTDKDECNEVKDDCFKRCDELEADFNMKFDALEGVQENMQVDYDARFESINIRISELRNFVLNKIASVREEIKGAKKKNLRRFFIMLGSTIVIFIIVLATV
jgi:hypothetical protein